MPFADITQPPAPLPSAKLQVLKPGISLQPPLTRLGVGPGIILLTTQDVYDEQVTQRDDAPTAVLKWAEEGYTVFQVSVAAVQFSNVTNIFEDAMKAFEQCEACQPKNKIGLVCRFNRITSSDATTVSDGLSRLFGESVESSGTGSLAIPKHRCERGIYRRTGTGCLGN